MDRYQSTIRQPVRFVGTGLHSGRSVNLEILPAKANTGIVFQRSDVAGSIPVAALAENITSSELSTTIGQGDNAVSTIEHLMAALSGLGIDNALIKVDAPEVPILDGSAAPFVDKILAAGITKLNASRKFLVVKEAFEIRIGDKLMRIEPAKRLQFSCSIDYGDAVIGKQSLDFTFSRAGFLKLSGSRTFCYLKEVNAMRAVGLALGGSLDNAVVVTESGVMNPAGLRSNDEFVRHKLLDCIGDLALLGAPLLAKVTLVKTGHALHAKFMTELLTRRDDLLSEVGREPVRDERKPAMSDGLTALTAAAAIYN